MISSYFKPTVTKIINPVARFAIGIGLTANTVSVIGALGSAISALYFYPRGSLVLGTLLVSFFALSDLFDGAMARASQVGASKWGGFLDSTLDRVTDSALLIGLVLLLVKREDRLYWLAIISLVSGLLIPYIRAKAESWNIECTVGIAERTERLIILLLAVLLDGLKIKFALAIGLWMLAILGVVTVAQRLVTVYRGQSSHER